MMKNNFIFYFSKITAQITKNIIYFPIWWYSKGAWKMLITIKKFLSGMLKSLALLVWIKNLFVPMYGQRDFAGFMISFFMRLFQIIFRSVVFLFFCLFSFLGILLWFLSPVLLGYEIIWQLSLIP